MNLDNIIQEAGPLTAADLILLLSKLPPDQVICFPRDEGGFSPVLSVKQLTLLENINDEYWYGPHDYLESIIDSDRKQCQAKEFIILLR